MCVLLDLRWPAVLRLDHFVLQQPRHDRAHQQADDDAGGNAGNRVRGDFSGVNQMPPPACIVAGLVPRDPRLRGDRG